MEHKEFTVVLKIDELPIEHKLDQKENPIYNFTKHLLYDNTLVSEFTKPSSTGTETIYYDRNYYKYISFPNYLRQKGAIEITSQNGISSGFIIKDNNNNYFIKNDNIYKDTYVSDNKKEYFHYDFHGRLFTFYNINDHKQMRVIELPVCYSIRFMEIENKFIFVLTNNDFYYIGIYDPTGKILFNKKSFGKLTFPPIQIKNLLIFDCYDPDKIEYSILCVNHNKLKISIIEGSSLYKKLDENTIAIKSDFGESKYNKNYNFHSTKIIKFEDINIPSQLFNDIK
jgi:hypothetical protein